MGDILLIRRVSFREFPGKLQFMQRGAMLFVLILALFDCRQVDSVLLGNRVSRFISKFRNNGRYLLFIASKFNLCRHLKKGP